METMIDQITETRLASACQCELAEVRQAASARLICQIGTSNDGAPLYLSTTIMTLRFVQTALRAGFDFEEVRMMISMIEIFGGGDEYVEQVIDDKLEQIHKRCISELERQQKVLGFRQWCRSQPDGYASLATIPMMTEGRVLS